MFTVGLPLGFYLLIAALIVCPFLVFTSENAVTGMTKVFILIWVMHYFNRSIVFPMRIKTKKKKMPLLIAVLAFLFNVVNGLVNGIYFGSVRFDYPEAWVSSPQFIVGISLFFVGFYINNKSDTYLIGLRKGKQKGYLACA